ncbi:MAG: sodium/glutamate symporter [Halanaerobium sp.]|nr:MAG: sodium/glutamate symporter [Halanaerobium sp.]
MDFSVTQAFSIVLLILAVGELVSMKTKAMIPSVFVSAVLFIIGFWTILPGDIVAQSSFATPVVYLSMYLLLTHMGTLMSLKELLAQWKTGGVVASILMSTAAAERGLTSIAVLATAMYVIQGFFGYPITSFLLKKEAGRLADKIKSGEIEMTSTGEEEADKEESKFRIIPPLPEKYQTTYVILFKLGLVAALSVMAAPILHLNEFVVCMLFGVIGREIGFLEEKALVKSGSFGFLITILMAFIFAGLSDATPEMLTEIAVPLFGIIVLGISGMAVVSALVGKAFGYTKEMSISIAMTALYGFPANYILTIESARANTRNDEEYQYAVDEMLPKMLVGGFATVTIASVIIAGFFVKLL